MRPHIHCLIMASAETLSDFFVRIMINSVSTLNEFIIKSEIWSMFNTANVCSNQVFHFVKGVTKYG